MTSGTYYCPFSLARGATSSWPALSGSADAAPDEVNRKTEKYDRDADGRPPGLCGNRVSDERSGGDDEEKRRPRIAGDTERTRSLWSGAPEHEDAGCSKPIENPADEHHVGEQLLERPGDGKHHRPERSRDDAHGRRSIARMHVGERPEEQAVSRHRVVDPRPRNGETVRRREDRHENRRCDEFRGGRTYDRAHGLGGHAI